MFLAGSAGTASHCPIQAGYDGDPALHGTAKGDAFHITANAPIVAYDVYPYGGGSSAITSSTLLLPTTAWDTNCIAVSAFEKSQIAGQPSLDIVAAEDATKVTILPAVNIVAGAGVSGGAGGLPLTYMLNRGGLLQFTQDEGLTGSPIQSDKPSVCGPPRRA